MRKKSGPLHSEGVGISADAASQRELLPRGRVLDVEGAILLGPAIQLNAPERADRVGGKLRE